MRIIKDILICWYKASFSLMDNDWMGWLVLAFVWVANGLLIYLIYDLAVRPILYKTKYSVQKIDEHVEVVDKQYYTTTTTTYVNINKVMTPIIITSYHHDVTLKGDIIDKTIDNEHYYDKLKQGQKVKVFYREKYETFRFSPEDNWKFVGHKIEEIL